MSNLENILDNNTSEGQPKKKLGILIILIHLWEFPTLLILALGIFEKVGHTQFIPGVSLIYWGLINWAMMSIFIPLIYEIQYRSKNVLNYILALGFGLLLCVNLFGKLEKVEHTQFIPGVSIIYWGLIASAAVALVFPFFHEFKRKAPNLNLIVASIFGVVLSFNFLRVLEGVEHIQLFQNWSLSIIPQFALFLITLGIIIFFIIKKAFSKWYIYHYIRFLLLIFLWL
jgi:hypothetical protein